MKISWLMLTMNRSDIVERSLRHNTANAGAPWDEFVWVDNGSFPRGPVAKAIESTVGIPHTECLYDANRGVARGYNTAMALASGTHLVITGCDRLMPEGWLSTMRSAFEKFPKLGTLCMWEKPVESYPERLFPTEKDPAAVCSALPLGARMFSREVLRSAGYLHQGFGLYGWEDVEWACRVRHRVPYLDHWVLNDLTAEHLGSEGANPYNGKDPRDYHEFKAREAADPKKRELFDKLKAEGFPYYNPF